MKRKARIHPSQGVRTLYSPPGTAPQSIPLSFLLCQLQPTGMRLLGLLREPPGLLGQCSCLGPQPQPQRAPLAPINLPFSYTSADLGPEGPYSKNSFGTSGVQGRGPPGGERRWEPREGKGTEWESTVWCVG